MDKNNNLKGKHREIVGTIKKKVYIAAAIPGIALILIIWALLNYLGLLDQFDNFALLFMAAMLFFLLILLLFKAIPLHSFEILIYSFVLLYFFTRIYFAFQVAVTTGDRMGTSDLLWIPVLYILGFTLLGKRRGFISSLIFALSMLILGMALVIQSGGTQNGFQSIFLLVKLFVVSAVSIFLLYMLSHIGEHHFKSLVAAEMNASLALTDSLTQADNRRQLEKHIQDEINRSSRFRHPVAIIMMDIDHFKKINDRYGHAVGDTVLVRLAELVQDNLRSLDKFGRWGGDEFICVALNSDMDESCQLAERLRKIIEDTTLLESVPITVSFGITVFGEGDTLESLINRADQGLMQAKSTGRNRVVCLEPGNEPFG